MNEVGKWIWSKLKQAWEILGRDTEVKFITCDMIETLCKRKVIKIPIDSLQYVQALKEGEAYLMMEESGHTWVWDGAIMEG